MINDGSTDETEQIALSYGDKIRYFAKENGGTASALNIGIQNMRGEYFSWLSHDDKYYPRKVTAQIEKLSYLTDKTDIIFCGWSVIDEKGREIHKVLPLKKYSPEQLETPLFALFHGQIGGCGLLIHRSHFNRAGLFRSDLPTTQDFDMWFRIMRNSPCRVCGDALYMTRVHDRQVSKTSRDVHAKESDALWIRMMETLSDGEKIRLDGTIQAFYKNVYLLLLTYSSNTGAIYYAKHKAAADSILPPGIREMPLCIFGHGMLLYRFLSVLKQGNLASVLKRICRAMQRIIDQYR